MKKLWVIIAAVVVIVCLAVIPAVTAQSMQATRTLRGRLVTIKFTAPADEFHAFGLRDEPPAGVRRYVSSAPDCAFGVVEDDYIEAIWFDILDEGDTVLFKYYANSRETEGFNGWVAYQIAGGEQQIVEIETVRSGWWHFWNWHDKYVKSRRSHETKKG